MKLRLLPALFLLVSHILSAQNTAEDENAIREIMAGQEAAWNRADIEGFMEGYWKSDSLCFIGSSGVTRGWQQTLDNYKKSYPDAEKMGKLTFTILSVEVLSPESAFVIGKWRLRRAADEPAGHYTLLWKKISGRWRIVADHSS